MTTRHFPSFTEARRQLRLVLDSAQSGRVTTVQRDKQRFAVVDAGQLAARFMRLRPSGALMVAEGGGWAALLPGLPVAGDGDTFEEAIDDLIDTLREYAQDWNDRLLDAPNHRDNRDVVEIVELASDDELRAWILAPDLAAHVTS
ncbi:MAG: prevent-host-death protein [Actinomycetota bacterium]|nr:prevent-host-death protein [Actinomycetota bacterium]